MEEKLLKALEEEAKRERESLLQEARREAQGIIEDAKKKRKERIASEIERFKLALKKETDRVLNAAIRESKEDMLKVKTTITVSVFDRAWERLMGLSLEERRGLILKFFKEVIEKAREDTLEGGFTIYVDSIVLPVLDSEDINRLKESFRIDIEKKDGINGAVLSAQGGRIEFHNTLKMRFDKIKEELLPDVGRRLFD